MRMKIIIYGFLLLTLLLFPIPSVYGKSLVFSLFEAAVRNSPNLMIAHKEIEEATLRKEIEARKGWPQVSFETNFTLYDPHNEDQYRDQEFLLSMNIDIFGKHAMKAKALETEYSVAQGNLKMERWHLFQQVASSYYKLVASLQQERLAKEQLKWARDLYHKTHILLRKGGLPEVSLIRAKGELQRARLEVENALKEKELALAHMRMWIPNFEIRPAMFKIPNPLPIKINQESLLQAFINFSPKIGPLKAKREKTIREARAEKLSFLPDLKVKGGYVVHREEADTGDYWMWSAGISVPLFDGGVRSRKVRLKLVEADRIELKTAALKRELELQANTIITKIKSAYKKWRLVTKEEKLYRDMARRMYKAYKIGGITVEKLILINRDLRGKMIEATELTCNYNYTKDVIDYITHNGGGK